MRCDTRSRIICDQFHIELFRRADTITDADADLFIYCIELNFISLRFIPFICVELPNTKVRRQGWTKGAGLKRTLGSPQRFP